MTAHLHEFAAEVGETGDVCVVGGRTRWGVGGAPAPGVREVRAPSGIREFDPAEMTVRVGAGTTVAELDEALGRAGQCVALPDHADSTIGGALAVGHSGVRRLGYGPVRDTLLEARVVGAHGRPVRAGGPTVKNVSGYDLCRLFVGSLGTLVLIGEVVLRTRPLAEASVWLSGEADPFEVATGLHRPVSVLWDGTRTWALVEGVGPAVRDQRSAAVRLGLVDEVAGPPPLPSHRHSVAPAALRAPASGWGAFVAQIGVGLVHVSNPQPCRGPDPGSADLNRRLKARFDPTGRLNPGRSPMAGAG